MTRNETAARNQEIANAYQSGKSSLQVAKDYGMEQRYIRTILKNEGVRVRRPITVKPKKVCKSEHYDPSQNWPEFPKVITENVYAYTTGYELGNSGNWSNRNGLSSRERVPVIKNNPRKK
jgi:hypothetical protein